MRQVLEVAGREVAITNPDKVLFPAAGHTKLDLVRYLVRPQCSGLQAGGEADRPA